MTLRKLIVPLVALFLCLSPALALASGGGGGGEAKKEEGEGGGKKKKGGDEGVTGGAFAGDPVYVHLQPLIFPIINDKGAQQIVTLIIDLQAKDFEAATNIHGQMPRLRDALIRALYGGLADGQMRNSHALDIPKIKDNIIETCNATFGAGSVIDVLMQAVGQRKL